LRVSVKFNGQVEMDLLFYKTYIVCHFIDRTTRWHASQEIPNKEDETLLGALMTTWVGIFGAPEELIVDCETGVVRSNLFKSEIEARGIKLVPRAPNQHARYIERRGAILRHAMHTIEDQLEHEGVAFTFKVLLAEATFAGNCLTYVGGVSPCKAVFGRQPSMLPPIPIAFDGLEPDIPVGEDRSG
jgi:hypothetical protein